MVAMLDKMSAAAFLSGLSAGGYHYVKDDHYVLRAEDQDDFDADEQTVIVPESSKKDGSSGGSKAPSSDLTPASVDGIDPQPPASSSSAFSSSSSSPIAPSTPVAHGTTGGVEVRRMGMRQRLLRLRMA